MKLEMEFGLQIKKEAFEFVDEYFMNTWQDQNAIR